YIEWMGNAGVHEDRVEQLSVQLRRVRGAHFHLRHRFEVLPRAGGERFVYFERDYATASTDAVRQDRRVVAERAADVQDLRAWPGVQRVDPRADRTRLAVEQLPI